MPIVISGWRAGLLVRLLVLYPVPTIVLMGMWKRLKGYMVSETPVQFDLR